MLPFPDVVIIRTLGEDDDVPANTIKPPPPSELAKPEVKLILPPILPDPENIETLPGDAV